MQKKETRNNSFKQASSKFLNLGLFLLTKLILMFLVNIYRICLKFIFGQFVIFHRHRILTPEVG